MLRSKRLHEELNENNAPRHGSFRSHAERRNGIDKEGGMWSNLLIRIEHFCGGFRGSPDPITDT